MHCKSLWIKASAKCINVNVNKMVQRGVGPAHHLPRNASSVSGLSILPAGHSGTPCASMLRQQVRGVIHKSPGRPRLETTLHAGERPSCVGSEQSALTEGLLVWAQNNLRSLKATHVPGKMN